MIAAATNAIRPRPYTAEEMRDFYKRGDTVAAIAQRAWYRDRTMTKDRVRAILFNGAES